MYRALVIRKNNEDLCYTSPDNRCHEKLSQRVLTFV